MRIVYDHTIFARHRRGGISRYFCELATRIGQEHQVTISAPLYSNLHLRAAPQLARGIYTDFGWGTGTVADVVGHLVGPRALGKLDILHETFYAMSSPYPTPNGRVATVHDMIYEMFYPERAMVKRKRATIERAQLILCVSNRTRDDLLNTVRIPQATVRVVHLGYELRETGKLARPVPVSFPYILVVGPRGEYKNFSLVLGAFSRSSRLRNEVGLVCFGGPEISREEREAIQDAGVTHFRYLTGDDATLAGYYREARAFVLPSRYEGFGIPVLEAMSLGCPVSCSRAGALPEIAGDAALFFDPNDIDECVNALERIISDTSLRADLCQRGGARVRGFGWEKCAHETSEAYRELC